MPRNRKQRRMGQLPDIKGMRPFGNRHFQQEPLILALEEYEAVRLTDYLLLTHQQGAKKMHVSRSTFTRMYETARKTIAQALVEGKQLVIEGGSVQLHETRYACRTCGMQFVAEKHKNAVSCPQCSASDVQDLFECYTHSCSECTELCYEHRNLST